MRAMKFGRMARLKLPHDLLRRCEVMQFETVGSPHAHRDMEIAIAVSGSGTVWVDGVPHHVSAGEFVAVPAEATHHMEPDEGEVLAMLIGYASLSYWEAAS